MKLEDTCKRLKDLDIKYSEALYGFDPYLELECFKIQAYNLVNNFKSATPLELIQCIQKYSVKDVYPNMNIEK